jgi:Kdo2-lipid IVA lauroyltransferase/acyltransferase
MNAAFIAKTGIFFLTLIARLPFKIIYILSDALYLIVYHLIGYRKKIVIQNLKNSFPEKDEKEIKIISKKFYSHFCDLIFETIKMREMTKNDFLERMDIKNADLINTYFDNGQSVVVLTMHYNNWEWSSCLPLHLKHRILGVYKPLHNRVFDKYLNTNREKMGSFLIPTARILRTVMAANKKNEPVFTGLAADQTPPVFHKFWMRFLNQEAMFYPGPAFISKRFNHPVFFQHIEKQGRGKYTVRFKLLCENPNEKSETEIMKSYLRKIEGVIKEKPEFYLWSHKRWKHKRPEGVPLQE